MKILDIETDATWQSGSSLAGYVTTTYEDIVAKFGEPTAAGDKTTAEWTLEFKVLEDDAEDEDDWDYVYATIYDWKESSTPMGQYRWHIGGFDRRAEECVQQALENNR